MLTAVTCPELSQHLWMTQRLLTSLLPEPSIHTAKRPTSPLCQPVVGPAPLPTPGPLVCREDSRPHAASSLRSISSSQCAWYPAHCPVSVHSLEKATWRFEQGAQLFTPRTGYHSGHSPSCRGANAEGTQWEDCHPGSSRKQVFASDRKPVHTRGWGGAAGQRSSLFVSLGCSAAATRAHPQGNESLIRGGASVSLR